MPVPGPDAPRRRRVAADEVHTHRGVVVTNETRIPRPATTDDAHTRHEVTTEGAQTRSTATPGPTPPGRDNQPHPTVGVCTLAHERRRADPRATDPRTTDPRATDPRTANLRATDPRAINPRAINPRTDDPRTDDCVAAFPGPTA
jgi:hypothetical protein